MVTYKDAGVDIDAADDAKKAMRKSIETGDARVFNTLGAFASVVEGTFSGYDEPVLVLKTEEPGSKQKLAFEHNYVRSICFDTINHLINDIAVMGATPYYVQDLIICGKLEKEIVTEIVDGFSSACKEQGCVLTGGETTEQPGVLEPGVYALAASIVGVAEKSRIIDGSKIENGDTVLAVASNGLHTNGYTLVRSLMEKNSDLMNKDVGGISFLEYVMKPHTCYFSALADLFTSEHLHGMAHITGGGMQDNINRVLPKGLDALVDLETIQIPEIFGEIRTQGEVEDSEMLRTFNMGVGLAMIVAKDSVEEMQSHLNAKGFNNYVIGSISSGDQSVKFENSLHWS